MESMVEIGHCSEVLAYLDDAQDISNIDLESNPKIKRLMELKNDNLLWSFVGPNGIMSSRADEIINTYINSSDPALIRSNFELLTRQGISLWRINTMLAQLKLGEVNKADESYMVDSVPLSLPRQDIDNLSDDIPSPTRIIDMDADQRSMVLLEGLDVKDDAEVRFNDLKPEFRESVLAYRLYEAIAKTRDEQEKQIASRRNVEIANQESFMLKGDLIHGTSDLVSFRQILQSGLVCGEFIGSKAKHDATPIGVDFSELSEDAMLEEDIYHKLISIGNTMYGPIYCVLRRDRESTDFGREVSANRVSENHKTIFGAVPSTEISTIIVTEEDYIKGVIDNVVENGFYVPVIDDAGTIRLTPERYEELRIDGNYLKQSIKPRIINSGISRDNSQTGSNDGALFIIDNKEYYVKFGDLSPLKRKQMWSEILADSIYRTVSPDIVPPTEAVVVEGRLARASTMMQRDGTDTTNQARNEGFALDCLLGNWDAVFNQDNLVMSGGHALRIDNGNCLDFRARGQLKEDGSFNEIVHEIEIGYSNENLADGMRQMYPDITDEQIRQQVISIKDKLTDEKIDELVDNIQRPEADRLKLKDILKKRRDYLIFKFLGEVNT